MKVNLTVNARFPSPIIGSINNNIPVSTNVYLYTDLYTISIETLVLYANYEGLKGSESIPKAKVFKSRENSLERYLLRASLLEVSTYKYKRRYRKGKGILRKII